MSVPVAVLLLMGICFISGYSFGRDSVKRERREKNV